MKTLLKTPLGICSISGDAEGISEIKILEDDNNDPSESIPEELKPAVEQLEQYFSGQRQEFQLKLNPNGTEFQKKVWNALVTIPFGKTYSTSNYLQNLETPKQFGQLLPQMGRIHFGSWFLVIV